MKHLSDTDEQRLAELLAEAGVGVPTHVILAVLRHLDWVLELNRTMNVTAITEPAEALRLHALDSLLVLPEVVNQPDGLLVDLGTGAGYPGVPLALASGRDALLIDSVGKKARALASFMTGVSPRPDIRVLAERVEDVTEQHRGEASVVVARAVSALPSLVELAAPLLAQAGGLIAMKGPVDEDELERGDAAGEVVGMRRVGLRRYAVPGGGEDRSVVVYERHGHESIELPRRVGLAQRRPLA